MKWQAMFVLILLTNFAIIAGAQTSTGSSTPAVAPQVRPALPQQELVGSQEQEFTIREKARELAQAHEEERLAYETLLRGYWVDPSTGLMWAAKDNGIAVTWHGARKYCRKLQLAGYSDWRLATLDELAGLVDKSAPNHERVGNFEFLIINAGRHVRGGLSLTGNPWSSNRPIDRFGHPYSDGWFFDFGTSKPSYDLQLFRNTKYALCVRRPLK